MGSENLSDLEGHSVSRDRAGTGAQLVLRPRSTLFEQLAVILDQKAAPLIQLTLKQCRG